MRAVRLMSLALGSAVLTTITACVLDDATAPRRSELVNTAGDPASGSVTGNLATVGSLTFPEAAPQNTSATVLHEGSASGWDQTDGLPQSTEYPWNTVVVPHAARAAFDDHLKQRSAEAALHSNELSGGVAGSIFEGLEAITDFVTIPGAVTFDGGTRSSEFRGYPHVTARWLDSNYAHATVPWTPSQAEINYQYADPYVFDDIRQRGARLYCAAREARARQAEPGRSSLGTLQIAETPIFDTSIGWLRSEAFARLWDPERPVDVAGDGSQAFGVPMTLGLVLRPTTLLPSLGEIRIPVTFVSGETEVRTLGDRRDIHVGEVCAPDFTCSPRYVNAHAKVYQTVTHADAIHTTGLYPSRRGEPAAFFQAKIPLAVIGPFLVSLTLRFDLEIGKPLGDDTRLLSGYYATSVPRALGSTFYDAGGIALTYFDGPWSRLRTPHWRLLDSPNPLIGVVSDWPAVTYLRPMQNDDHAVDLRTTLGLGATGTIEIIEDIDFFGVSVDPELTVGLSGTWTHDFRLRDALRAEQELGVTYPSSALTVTPSTSATLDFDGVTFTLVFHVEVFGIELDFPLHIPLVRPFQPAAWNSDDENVYGEANRLRIGYGGPGDVRNQPYVHSHLPGGSNYVTFADETVEECLDEPEVLLGEPPRCEPDETPSTPNAALCLFVDPTGRYFDDGGDETLDVCTDIFTYVNSFPVSQRACVQHVLDFFCEEKSQQQDWKGKSVVARVMQTDADFWSEFNQVAEECVHAFVPSHNETLAEQFAAEFFGAAACDADDATLYDPPANPTTIDPTSPDSACGGS